MSLLDRLEKQKFSVSGERSAEITLYDEYSDLKERVHKDFIETVNQQDISLFGVKEARRRIAQNNGFID